MIVFAMLIGFSLQLLCPLSRFTERVISLTFGALPRVDGLLKRVKVAWFRNIWVSALLFPIIITILVWLLYVMVSLTFLRFVLLVALCYVMTSSAYSWPESTREYYTLSAADYEEATRIVSVPFNVDASDQINTRLIHRSNALMMNGLEESVAVPLFFLMLGGTTFGVPFMAFAWAIQWMRKGMRRDEDSIGKHQVIEIIYMLIAYIPVRLFAIATLFGTRLLRLPWLQTWRCFSTGFGGNPALPLAVGETALGISYPTPTKNGVDDTEGLWQPEPRDIIRMNHIATIAICGFVLMLCFLYGVLH